MGHKIGLICSAPFRYIKYGIYLILVSALPDTIKNEDASWLFFMIDWCNNDIPSALISLTSAPARLDKIFIRIPENRAEEQGILSKSSIKTLRGILQKFNQCRTIIYYL